MATPTIEYTWKIERLDCYPTLETYDNVVTRAYWRVYARGSGCEATSYGTVELASIAKSFTPFEQLTEAQVVGWVRARVDGAAQEALLAQSIADQLSPPVVSPPLPWSADPPAAPTV
jgi:hypothetical protein